MTPRDKSRRELLSGAAIGLFLPAGASAVAAGAQPSPAVPAARETAELFLPDPDQSELSARGRELRDSAVSARRASADAATAAVLAMESRFRRTNEAGRRLLLAHVAWAGQIRTRDDSARSLIQAALDLRAYWRFAPLTIEPGIYDIDDSLWVTRGLGQFSQGVLQGSGRGFENRESLGGTLIRSTMTDRPAIIHQGGRYNEVRDLQVSGPLMSHIENAGFCIVGTPAGTDEHDPANWSHGLPAGRYNPLPGIAVDPYGATGGPPSPAYARTDNPLWAGPDIYYGRNVTWGNLHERINIQGYVVAFAVHPCPDERQGDLTRLRDFEIAFCTYGVSIGNTQSRNVEIRNGTIRNVFCAITNCTFGPQHGQLGGPIENICAFQLVKALDLRMSTSGPVTVRNFYAESIWTIGDLRNGASVSQAIVLDGCHFIFDHGTDGRGAPRAILSNPEDKGGGYASSLVTVRDSMLQADWYLGFDVKDLRVEGVRVWINSVTQAGSEGFPPLTPARAMAHNGTAGGIDDPVFNPPGPHLVGYHPINLDTLAVPSDQAWTGDSFRHTSRTHCIPYWMAEAVPRLAPSRRDAVRLPRSSGFMVAKSALSDWSGNGRRISFRNSLAEPIVRQRGCSAGRVVRDSVSGARFFIESYDPATGRTVMAALTGWYRRGGAEYLRDAFDRSAGYLFFCETGLYTPSLALLGDVTAGSPQVANLRSPDGVSNWLAGEVAAGDWLWIDQGSAPFAGEAARVARFDPARAVMTMAGPAATGSSQIGRRFELFLRMI